MNDKKVRILFWGLMVFLLLLATGIYKKKEQERVEKEQVLFAKELKTLPTQEEISLKDYFPIEKDVLMNYKGETYLEDVTVSVDYLKENMVQMRYQTKSINHVKIYVIEEEAIYEVATVQNATTKVDYTMLRQYKNALLKLPLEEGASWTQMDGTVKTIKKLDANVQTQMGNFTAIQVLSEGTGFEQVDYYAHSIGLIKSIRKEAGKTNELTLTTKETGKGTKHIVNLYIGNNMNKQIEKSEKEMNVLTNEEPKHFLTDLLNKTSEIEYIVALPQGAMINSIYIDQEKDRIMLDMNEDYELSLYEKTEAELALLSLVKTVGSYYDVSFVVLTIEGSPYERMRGFPNLGNPIYIKEE